MQPNIVCGRAKRMAAKRRGGRGGAEQQQRVTRYKTTPHYLIRRTAMNNNSTRERASILGGISLAMFTVSVGRGRRTGVQKPSPGTESVRSRKQGRPPNTTLSYQEISGLPAKPPSKSGGGQEITDGETRYRIPWLVHVPSLTGTCFWHLFSPPSHGCRASSVPPTA